MTRNIVDEKDEVIDRIMQSIADYFRQLASAKNITLTNNQNPMDVILAYHRAADKIISNKARDVVISKTLTEKMETKSFEDKDGNTVDEREADDICKLIENFENKFRNGEDITNHSSKGIFSDSEDIILNYWNLRHLHLSKVETAVDKVAMSGNRSSWLLFYFINEGDVYFVDVVCHPTGAGFTAFWFLEIIQENGWMETIGFREISNMIPDSLEPKITKDEDIFELYKHHIDGMFEFDGKAYLSCGVTSAGYGFNSVFGINQFRKYLRQILDEYKYVEFIAESNGNDSFKLVFEDRDGQKLEMEYSLSK